jgi:hypothetical protein
MFDAPSTVPSDLIDDVGLQLKPASTSPAMTS